MNWRDTKLGNYIWTNLWYRVDWLIYERQYNKWIKWAKKHQMWITITKEYLDRMDNPKMIRLSNLFKDYDKWKL